MRAQICLRTWKRELGWVCKFKALGMAVDRAEELFSSALHQLSLQKLLSLAKSLLLLHIRFFWLICCQLNLTHHGPAILISAIQQVETSPLEADIGSVTDQVLLWGSSRGLCSVSINTSTFRRRLTMCTRLCSEFLLLSWYFSRSSAPSPTTLQLGVRSPEMHSISQNYVLKIEKWTYQLESVLWSFHTEVVSLEFISSISQPTIILWYERQRPIPRFNTFSLQRCTDCPLSRSFVKRIYTCQGIAWIHCKYLQYEASARFSGGHTWYRWRELLVGTGLCQSERAW
jgi:hypothetical protein